MKKSVRQFWIFAFLMLVLISAIGFWDYDSSYEYEWLKKIIAIIIGWSVGIAIYYFFWRRKERENKTATK